MFAPRYSIRTILIVMTGLAFYFLLAGLGVRGHAWAGGIAIGVGSLLVVALVHAAFFYLFWTIGQNKQPTRPRRLDPAATQEEA
jgi:Na+-driven multidrug efflux pump